MSLKVLIVPTAFAAIVIGGAYKFTPLGDAFHDVMNFGKNTSEEVTTCSVDGAPKNEDGSCDYSPAPRDYSKPRAPLPIYNPKPEVK